MRGVLCVEREGDRGKGLDVDGFVGPNHSVEGCILQAGPSKVGNMRTSGRVELQGGYVRAVVNDGDVPLGSGPSGVSERIRCPTGIRNPRIAVWIDRERHARA